MSKRENTLRVATTENKNVTVSIPLGSHKENGYQTQVRLYDQIHVRRLTERQRVAMAYMVRDLHEAHETLNGRHVDDQSAAVRWLLEAVADAYQIP